MEGLDLMRNISRGQEAVSSVFLGPGKSGKVAKNGFRRLWEWDPRPTRGSMGVRDCFGRSHAIQKHRF